MNPCILLALVAPLFSSAPSVVFDSAGVRRPQLRLSNLAMDWRPPLLADAEPVWLPRLPRKRLTEAATPFQGSWAADFPRFKRMWPSAVKDGSWQVLVAAFWRRIQGLDSDFGDGPSRDEWPALLAQWADWIETIDIRLRPSLGEVTGRELCRAPKVYGGPVVEPGGSVLVDPSRAVAKGPISIRIQRFERKGLAFVNLVSLPSPKPWTPGADDEGFLRIQLPQAGLYRVVLRAPGWYHQLLLQATSIPTMTAPTDSGVLIWAPGGGKNTKKHLVWKRRDGQIDSVRLGNAPLHVGLSAADDSGLVAVAIGQELSPLRLRRPRPAQATALFGSMEMDWYGRPSNRPPRRDAMDFAWQAALVATPSAVEEGDWMRVSGLVRRLDPYGRPDSAQADSVILIVDQDSMPSLRKAISPDAWGILADSIRISRDARLMLEAIHADGREVIAFYGATAQVRVRRPATGCLNAQDSADMAAAPARAEESSFYNEIPTGALAVLSNGRVLDWRFVDPAGDRTLRIPPQAEAAAGGTVDLLVPGKADWTMHRTHDRSNEQDGEAWMGLTMSPVADTVAAGSKLELRIVPRNGDHASTRLMVSLTPDSLAGSLTSLNVFHGKAWGGQELTMPDQNVQRLGVNNFASPWDELDNGREPDRLGRLGLLANPALCIRCRPWTGSYSSGGRNPQPPHNSASFTIRSVPCRSSDPIQAPAIWTGPIALSEDGRVPGDHRWPASPGRYRLQAWGIDEVGRHLGWEKVVVVR